MPSSTFAAESPPTFRERRTKPGPDIEARGLDPEDEEARIDEAFAALNQDLLASGDENQPIETRMGRLAWRCIFGCDAEPRAARTAKMNMIMHGDGHGGIHHHDGLVDINGIFPTRFDVVVTNPPFGSNVGNDQKVDGGDETRVHKDNVYRAACLERYGEAWEQSHRRMLDAGRAGFSPALRCLIRQWGALEPWIVSQAVKGRRSCFPLTLLRDVVTRRREAVALSDSFRDWTPITVHLSGEISARDRTNPCKGGMFAAYPGDIVFSRIDARSGAIGVLQENIAKAVVTSEFPVFVPASERLDGKFVKLVLRTGNFLAALRAKASGTSGRKRIAAEAFVDLRVPLPPLREQRAMIAAHRAEVDRAAELEREAHETETQAMMAFETALGFSPQAPLPDRPVFIASFKDLDR